jgi:NADH:ubiquinone oxidoreductase subunit E
MAIRLTMCSLCTLSRPEFMRAVAQIIAEHQDEIVLIELECMAACDDVPAVMLDYDYHPQVSPSELHTLVGHLLHT